MSVLSLRATRNMCLGYDDYEMRLGGQGEHPVRKRRTIKLGGFALQLDGMGWFLLAIAIIAIGIVAFGHLRTMAKNSSEQVELSSLRDAVMQYQSLRLDGAAPASLEQLIADPSIPAAQAIDGINHGPILAPNDRWKASGTVTDVWGTAYTYTVNADGSGTITSTGSGNNLSIDF